MTPIGPLVAVSKVNIHVAKSTRTRILLCSIVYNCGSRSMLAGLDTTGWLQSSVVSGGGREGGGGGEGGGGAEGQI